MGHEEELINQEETAVTPAHKETRRILNQWWFTGIVLFIALMVRLYNFDTPLLDIHSFRQTQTASVARNFYNMGINPLTSKLDVFGVGKEENLLLEFPFYQTIVAVLYKIFYPGEIWGRIVSIFFGFLGAFYLFRLVHLLVDRNTALWSCFFFLFAPLNIYYHRAFMMDTAVVCFGIMMLYYLIHWIKTDSTTSYLTGIAAASLGFIMKPPYGGVLLLPIAYFQFRTHGSKGLIKPKFLAAMLIPLIIVLIWQSYAEGVNVRSGHEFFTLSNESFRYWNFGKLEYRFNAAYWLKMLDIFNKQVLGQGIIILFIAGLFLKPAKISAAFFHFWLLAEFIYVLIMIRMTTTHNYYNMPLIPIASIYCGVAVNYFLEKNRISHYLNVYLKKAVIATIVCLVIFFNFRHVLPWYIISWPIFYDGQIIQKYTSKDTPIIYSPYPEIGDWDPAYFYYANRRGIYLTHLELTPQKIAELKEDGYGYLVITNLTRNIQMPYKVLAMDKRKSAYIYDLNQTVNSQ